MKDVLVRHTHSDGTVHVLAPERLLTFGKTPAALIKTVTACLDFRPRFEWAMQLLPCRQICHVLAPLVADVLTRQGIPAELVTMQMEVSSTKSKGPGFVFYVGEVDEHPNNFHLVVRSGDYLIDPTVGQVTESVHIAMPNWSRQEHRYYLRDFPDWLIAPYNPDAGLKLKRVVIRYRDRPERQQAWASYTAAALPVEVRERLAAMAVERLERYAGRHPEQVAA